ncbi:protein tilB homolog [Ceratina calcarata]|uniref:Protein tilB homolog n=1 Tax=Ceratina calcarata TaxID=156304 RepID=A0AAJ7J8P5_9HYME|nr:protein tilB homolog [Ceratina calcarata]
MVNKVAEKCEALKVLKKKSWMNCWFGQKISLETIAALFVCVTNIVDVDGGYLSSRYVGCHAIRQKRRISLADFQYCLSLQELFVRNNNIEDLNEVCYLQGLPNLRNLWLGENPCAEKEGYRLAVLRALPNLQKLDDELVTPEEVQTALIKGRVLVHPLDVYASPPQSDAVSPEDITTEYIEETEVIQHRRYSSSSDQRSFEETQHPQEEYHDPDHRNANYNASPSHHYSQNNQYTYEVS